MNAVIDIGSNSVRSLWQLAEDDPGIQSIHYTRLAGDLNRSGRISREALWRTIEAVQRLLKEMPETLAEECLLVATFAFREALNAKEARKELSDAVGRPVVILTEEQEAYYGYLGAGRSFQGEPLAVMDAGGGSTELSWETEDFVSHSVPLGALRLKPEDLKEEAMKERLLPLVEGYPLGHKKLIAIGGTATSVASMQHAMASYDSQKIHGSLVKLDELRILYKNLSEMSLEKRRHIPGLPVARADIILPGIAILIALAELIEMDEMTVSTQDILHGLIGLHPEFFFTEDL